MFMKKKKLTNTIKDNFNKVLEVKTRTVYLCDGQTANEKTLHAETQKLYKKLYEEQEKQTQEKDRPVTIFELFGLTNKFL